MAESWFECQGLYIPGGGGGGLTPILKGQGCSSSCLEM